MPDGDDPNPHLPSKHIDLEAIRERLEAIRKRAEAATPGPWWDDSDDGCWRLHGVHARIPLVIGGETFDQVINHQIIKAPKRDTSCAEYWPNEADAAFIVHARQDIPLLVRALEEACQEISRLREVQHIHNGLAAALGEIRAAGLDPRLLRWCSWPGCLASFDASTGPEGGGWKQYRHMAVLLCPEHGETGHWPSYDMDRDDLTRFVARCGCGESAEVRPSNWEAVFAWWECHLAGPATASVRWRCNTTERCLREDGHDGAHGFAGVATAPYSLAWKCPVDGHQGVEQVVGETLCTAYACGRTSTDPVPRGYCFCDGDTRDGDDCTGQCCGPGQCSCSPSACSRCGRSGAHTCKRSSVTGSQPPAVDQ